MAERPPAVFTIPAGVPFAGALAQGILDRHGAEPLQLAAVTVLLPTRRACRSLREAFLRVGEGRPLLLPTIRPLGDVAEDELALTPEAAGADLPPALPDFERLLTLARLVAMRPDIGNATALAVQLARELAALVDSVETEGLSLDNLDKLVPERFETHWQATLKFLDIVRLNWPAILAERGAMNPAARRIALIDAAAERWRAAPPSHPVYAAGSTGSIPATGRLLGLVARLPQGAVVLPGFDTALDVTAHEAILADSAHPQHGMMLLLREIRVDPREVLEWTPPASPARNDLFRVALAPASLTADWPALPPPPDAALAGLRLLVAPTAREEALAIALMMRGALEVPGRTAALVTPDRALARRVATELARWNLLVDDSAGQPLATTPPATMLRLVADMAASEAAPVPLLAMLKHPLARGDGERYDFLKQARRLDRQALRGLRPAAGFAGVIAAAEARPELQDWLAPIAAAMQPLMILMQERTAPLSELLSAAVQATEWLAGGSANLYAGEAGEALATMVADMLAAASALGPVAPGQLPALLDQLMTGVNVRPRFGAHPRLAILGLLEARLLQADLVILGGLNEGTWPPEPAEDPWLSRPMRAQFGLPPAERRIGLTAHDFVQAASGRDVVLTRARKVDGTPTVPSRWLLRLDALLADDLRWQAMADAPELAWGAQLDWPASIKPVEAPAPRPPVAARPRALSVTRIEAWIRDPYAIYARYVLKLKPLDPLDAPADALMRGTAIHKALEDFVNQPELPGAARLEAMLVENFGELLERPMVRAFWRPRLARIATWFADYEKGRRAAGTVTVATERKGTLILAGLPGGDFELSGTGDRIDRLADGTLAILDYKTGRAPSMNEVLAGLNPQLTLEAAIAAAGGFPGVDAAPVSELAYVRVTGNEPPGENLPLNFKRDKQPVATAAVAQEALDALRTWVVRFDDPQTPYRSRPRPQFLDYAGDYDHLARVAEWAANGGEE